MFDTSGHEEWLRETGQDPFDDDDERAAREREVEDRRSEKAPLRWSA